MPGKMRRRAREKEEKEKRVGETILSAMLVQARSFIFTHPHALSGKKMQILHYCVGMSMFLAAGALTGLLLQQSNRKQFNIAVLMQRS